MPSNSTQNYALNQWAAGDRVLRTDFNADNAKIDAAIKAVDTKADSKADASALAALKTTVDESPYVRLASVTTTAAQTQIDLSVSGFNIAQFQRLEIHISGRTEGSGGVSVLLNGQTAGYTSFTVNNNPSTASAIGHLPMGPSSSGGVVVIYICGNLFFGKSYGAANMASYVSFSSHDYTATDGTKVTPASLRTINLRMNGNLTALSGTKVTVTGVRL